jgi:hypothetical protein
MLRLYVIAVLFVTMEAAFDRDAAYESAASTFWGPLEPNVPGNSKYPPLHDTIFSADSYKYTFEYNNPELDVLGSDPFRIIAERVQSLERKTRVYFYEDASWFIRQRNRIKCFVAWCDLNQAANYYLSSNTISKFLEDSIQSKKEELIAAGRGDAADNVPENTVYNYIRTLVAIVERLALWQGLEEFSKNLTKHKDVGIIYMEVKRAALAANSNRPLDYHAIDRTYNKRINEEERSNLNDAMFTFNPIFSNSTVLMRAFLEDKLGDACGRRGEDLREVSYFACAF